MHTCIALSAGLNQLYGANRRPSILFNHSKLTDSNLISKVRLLTTLLKHRFQSQQLVPIRQVTNETPNLQQKTLSQTSLKPERCGTLYRHSMPHR